MSTYHPDRWVIVKFTNGDVSYEKVFAGWYGGFAGSDSWKLSSGTVSTVVKENTFEFKQETGSTYICHKKSYGLSSYMASVFEYWIKMLAENDSKVTMEIVPEDEVIV